MVKNEDYIKLLNKMVSCISYGDYYAVKELSILQLKNMKTSNEKIGKELKEIKERKKLCECKKKPLEEWDKKELLTLIKIYSNYIMKRIEKTNTVQELQNMTVTIDEFLKNISMYHWITISAINLKSKEAQNCYLYK